MGKGTEMIRWDEDMDWLLLQFTERGMSYKATASALSVSVGFEVHWHAVRNRLVRHHGHGYRRPRGLGITNLLEQTAA